MPAAHPPPDAESRAREPNSFTARPEPERSARTRLLVDLPPETLVVHEIYRSIQGESTFAGLPCVFVRLAVCQLRCHYCDTPHAFQNGQRMSLEETTTEALLLGDRLVEITGGEPLLQPSVFPLMTRLADAGRTVLLETSGSLDVKEVDPRVRIILDIKTPGSGEVHANLWSNLGLLKASDEVKFVVVNRADFDWSLFTIKEHALLEKCPVLVSASHGEVAPRELAAWILESRLPIRYQSQLHKEIWGPTARGV